MMHMLRPHVNVSKLLLCCSYQNHLGKKRFDKQVYSYDEYVDTINVDILIIYSIALIVRKYICFGKLKSSASTNSLSIRDINKSITCVCGTEKNTMW